MAETSWHLVSILRAVSRKPGRKLAAGLLPDIALIDLGLPDGSSIKIIECLQRLSPQTLCIVASIYDDDGHILPRPYVLVRVVIC